MKRIFSTLTLGESVVAMGRQLIIVDVQVRFAQSEKIVTKILDYAKGFDEVLFIYDVLDKDDVDMWEDMQDSDLSVKAIKIPKEYAFFRGYMDTDVDEDDIVKIAKYMIKNDIRDSRDIEKGVFSIVDEKVDSIFIPDLVDVLKQRVKSRPILIGGARNECLREVYLLLEALDKKPEINSNYVY